MKKSIALLLAILMLLMQLSALAEAPAAEAETPVVYDHLTVGNTTPMRGDFFTALWGNATSDVDVRSLLHGYNLIDWDGEQGVFTADPTVVTDLAAFETDNGDHEYVIMLAQDLFYSDGRNITARDYAFSILLQMAPEIRELGGVPTREEHLLGYEEYINGTVPYLAGVRLLDDYMMSITIRREFLPFFYEMGLLLCNPYPMHVLAPGVTVADDGNGVYLTNEDPTVTEPVFTAELLKRTILDPVTGYRSHPSVVSGPYTLTSWDGVTCEFAVNPYFKGDQNGTRPSIPTLTYTLAENDTMMEKLANGEFDLLDKVMKRESIAAGMELLQTGNFAMGNEPRLGLSYISFSCEKKTVASEKVRQAIMYCFDRDSLVEDYVGDNGLRVDSFYGLGQWMYTVVMGTVAPPVPEPENPDNAAQRKAYEDALAEYEALSLDSLNPYGLNIQEANRLLDQDGWKLNAQGIREKEIDGETVTLDLRMIYPEGNDANTVLETALIANLEQVGIHVTMEAVPMGELLARYYKQGERDMDMVYMATNFDQIFDPSVYFRIGPDGEMNWSFTNHADSELYQKAVELRQTEPGDVLEYVKRWITFLERFNETLPMIPVYSNIYFDFYIQPLRNYNIAGHDTWGQAIVESYLSDEEPEPEVEEAEEGELEFD